MAEIEKDLQKATLTEAEQALAEAKASGNQEKGAAALSQIVESLNALTKISQEVVQSQKDAIENAKLKEIETSNISEFFSKASEEEKKALYKQAVEEFGADQTNAQLFGGTLEKALMFKVMPDDPKAEQKIALQKTHDLVHTMTAMQKGITSTSVGDGAVVDPTAWRRSCDLLEKQGGFNDDGTDIALYRAAIRKASGDSYDAATNGDGAEFVPVNLSQDVIRALWLELKIAPLFKRVAMTSPTFDMPRITSRGRAYIMDSVNALAAVSNFFEAATGATLDGFDTAKITFTAKKLSVVEIWNDEIQEDAIVAMARLINEDVVASLASSIDDACMNGIRTGYGTTLDNAGASKLWTSTADARYAWDGIRKYFELSTRTAIDGSTFTLADLREARKKMGKYGVNPSELVWIVSPNTYADLLGFDEVLRWRDIQDKATVLTGQLGEIDGIPIIVSEYMYTNLNASGVYDNITTTKTVAAIVRPSAYMMGDRRSVRTEYDRNIFAGLNGVVSTWRGDFQKLRPGTTTAAQAEEYMIKALVS